MIYCQACNGMVNPGGLCPHEERPDNCPLQHNRAEYEKYEKATKAKAAKADDTNNKY